MRYDDYKSVILVVYYDGAYGPTIRIDAQVREALIKVRKIGMFHKTSKVVNSFKR